MLCVLPSDLVVSTLFVLLMLLKTALVRRAVDGFRLALWWLELPQLVMLLQVELGMELVRDDDAAVDIDGSDDRRSRLSRRQSLDGEVFSCGFVSSTTCRRNKNLENRCRALRPPPTASVSGRCS